jgi:glucose-fructose oxidoreductase
MVRADTAPEVKLMIAYRLHFEAANLKTVQMVRSGNLGEPRSSIHFFTIQVEKDSIRLKKDLPFEVVPIDFRSRKS